ncbi:MAG: hypothetical protein CVT98_02185 [Bacteroidetes bacterium HGW-Bacteroidetes-15]|nr:MAG: hypothetical protein CVT98_02185 [Bacteroidetes bacterium HGW-Bacteroidetes-15]
MNNLLIITTGFSPWSNRNKIVGLQPKIMFKKLGLSADIGRLKPMFSIHFLPRASARGNWEPIC